MMTSPDLELNTCYVLDERGRIVETREPQASPGPLFVLIRSATDCAWAIHRRVPDEVAARIAVLASSEVPTADLREEPIHAAAYVALTRGRRGFCGPAFDFPEQILPLGEVVQVQDEGALEHHFNGWVRGEIAAGRAPVCAVLEDERPVSICFCARSSELAAAAGLETAQDFRGRSFGPRVVAAWVLAIRASGRLPLYSAAWDNAASLAVARKLGMMPVASFWNVTD